MKHSTLLLLVPAIVLVSCTQQETEPVSMGDRTITAVFGESEPETRTCAGESSDGKMYGILWSPGDVLGVYSSDGSENAEFMTNITDKKAEADFNGTLARDPAYAYYPYDAANDGKTTITGNLPLVQAYSSADGRLAYDYRIGRPVEGSSTRFKFNTVFPVLRFTVDATGTDIAEDKLESIIVEFPSALNHGEFTLLVSGGTPAFTSATDDSNTLTLNFTDTPALSSGKTVFGYLSCPEISGLSGKSVKVTLITNLYSVSFNAEFKVDTFTSGSYYTFPLTLAEWKKKLGDGFSVKERPSLTALSFKAANNSGKILAKKLTYSVTGYEGTLIDTRVGKTSYTTAASATTKTMEISSGAISGCIPYLFDRNLVPTMTYTSGASVSYSIDGCGSFSDWDGKSAIDFTYGNIIRISKDGAYRDYEVQITNTGLPVVVINQPGGNVTWSEVGESYWSKDSDFDNITGGTMTIYNADGSISLASCDAATRIRGNSTQDMPKKPFAVKLGSKASVLGMNKHKRWVLLANWKDRSLLRNDICLGIARKFAETPFPDGSDNGNGWQVDGRFVELVYNGVHVGNYYLCEQIKIDKNRLNISGEYDGSAVTDADAAKFGYLMEVDDNFDEVDKFVTRFGLPIMFKDELDAGGILMANVKRHILDIEQKLYNGYKGTTSAFDQAFAEMNINSFVDQFLIYEFCMNSEFVNPKSVYLYQDGSGPLFAGPVWDFDWQSFPSTKAIGGCLEDLQSSWDRDYTKSLLATPSFQGNSYWYNTIPAWSDDLKKKYAPVWYPMLIKSTEFQDLCAARWSQMKPILEAYASQIPEHGAMLEKSWEENNSFWPSFDATLDKRPGGQTGYCGDEKAATYKEVYKLLQNSYSIRLAGMNFVTSKDWPSFSITEK